MRPPSPGDLRWLDAAVAEATPLLGTTAENPTVGAIIVDPATGVELARAVTAPGGRPHAESQAIAKAGAVARGATLYVTLEPCNHFGRTPPCVDAVLAAGIRRVVIGIVDPDPRTFGGGLERLAQAGVEIVVADHPGSRRLHEGHVMRKRRGRPFVTAKLAVSADGMVGRHGVGNVAITGAAAQQWTHLQRARSNAVMVGAGTAIADDPRLTVRLDGLADRRPLRVVVAGRHALPANLRLFATADTEPIALIAGETAALLPLPGVNIIRVAEQGGRPDLAAALAALGENGIQTVLVEGGPALLEALLVANLIDRFELLESPAIVGPDGVPATETGSMSARLAAAGFSAVDQQALGSDKLRTFARMA